MIAKIIRTGNLMNNKQVPILKKAMHVQAGPYSKTMYKMQSLPFFLQRSSPLENNFNLTLTYNFLDFAFLSSTTYYTYLDGRNLHYIKFCKTLTKGDRAEQIYDALAYAKK